MTQDTHILIWDRCLKMIEQIVSPRAFETWFKPIRPESFLNGVLTVNVPSEFFREYLEEYYLDVLKKTLKKEIGADAKLVYRVAPVRVQPPMEYPAAAILQTAPTSAVKEAAPRNSSDRREPCRM